jgi:transposase
MKDFLTAQEINILREAHHSAWHRKSADRIKTILFLNEGFSFAEVAKLLLLDDTTIRRYLKEYNKKGVDGLLESRYHGSTSLLTKAQEASLTLHLKEHTYQKVSGAIAYVAKTYHVTYSPEGMTHLLHRLGFTYKKMKLIPGKLNPAKQEAFKEEYEQLKNTLRSEDKIYFLDACHPQHNSIATYGWIYTKDTKTLKTNTARKRINLNGAVNIQDMNITVLEEPTINADAAIRLVEAIEKRQPTGKIYLIMDNARYNHAKKLKTYIKDKERIQIIYLPAYSPNLNIIERLWKFFKEEKLRGQYYETYQEFRTTVMNFFRDIEQYKPRLKTRLTDSFQTVSV